MFRKILVAVDGSTGNERILLFAEHLARVEQAQLILVHAYELPSVYEWTDGFDGLRAQYEAIAAEVVRDAQEVLGAAGSEAEVEIRSGVAVEVVLQAARRHEADLIVIGSRTPHRETAGDSMLGSVSAAVLRESACPVLVVP
jgi:nucleotide-binding universal stress UspA family protein